MVLPHFFEDLREWQISSRKIYFKYFFYSTNKVVSIGVYSIGFALFTKIKGAFDNKVFHSITLTIKRKSTGSAKIRYMV